MIQNQFLHYQLTERLGEGPLGETWQAYDAALERGVAVKLVRPYANISDDLRARFVIQQEQLRTRQFAPASAFDWETEGERQGIIRELIEGVPLGEMFRSGGNQYQAMLSLLTRLARIVKTIHECDLIHGNIHPWNIILDADGRPHLTDMLPVGISRDWLPTVPPERRVFIAPEIIAGRLPDKRADMYALAAIGFYMLVGEQMMTIPDFRLERLISDRGVSTDADLFKKLEDLHLPDEAWLLFEVLLAPDPKDRFADIEGLLSTLDELRHPAKETAFNRGKRHSPRTYLMLSILAVLLIIFWIVIASVKR